MDISKFLNQFSDVLLDLIKIYLIAYALIYWLPSMLGESFDFWNSFDWVKSPLYFLILLYAGVYVVTKAIRKAQS
jgi:hypothetical protein